MTALPQLRQTASDPDTRNTAEFETKRHERSAILQPYLRLLTKLQELVTPDSSEYQQIAKLIILVEMTELDKIKAVEAVAEWHVVAKPTVLARLSKQ